MCQDFPILSNVKYLITFRYRKKLWDRGSGFVVEWLCCETTNDSIFSKKVKREKEKIKSILTVPTGFYKKRI